MLHILMIYFMISLILTAAISPIITSFGMFILCILVSPFAFLYAIYKSIAGFFSKKKGGKKMGGD